MYICSYLYKGMLEYRVVKVKVPNQPPISCLHRLSCRMVLAVLAIAMVHGRQSCCLLWTLVEGGFGIYISNIASPVR